MGISEVFFFLKLRGKKIFPPFPLKLHEILRHNKFTTHCQRNKHKKHLIYLTSFFWGVFYEAQKKKTLLPPSLILCRDLGALSK